jgi:hypothetical protein
LTAQGRSGGREASSGVSVLHAEVERAASFARALAAPLGELPPGEGLSLGPPRPERADAADLASRLPGPHWVIPLEISGSVSGAACLLLPRALLPGGEAEAALARLADDYVARAADRLTASRGEPVTVDRLGLRVAEGEAAAESLADVLGPGDLVAVGFEARSTAGETGVVLAALAADLVKELSPPAPPSRGAVLRPGGGGIEDESRRRVPHLDDLIRRTTGLAVKVSAEVGAETKTVGELLRVRQGTVLRFRSRVTDPASLRIGGRVSGAGEVVTARGRLGVRVRSRS